KGVTLGEDSVSIENINFTKKTKNLFKGYESGYLNTGTDPWEIRKSSNGVTAVVEVEKNSTYHVRKFGNSDRFRIAGSVNKPVFKVGDDVDSVSYHYSNDHDLNYYKVNTQDNNYILIQVSNSGEKPQLNITKDIDYEYYIPPRKIDPNYIGEVILKDNSIRNNMIIDKEIEVDKLSFVNKSNNLFSGYDSGIINTSGSPWLLHPSETGVVTVVPVENNSTYHIRKFDESDRLRIVGTIQPPIFEAGSESNTHYGNQNADSRTVVDTYDNNYLVIQVSNSLQTPRINITKDVDYEYDIQRYVIDKNYVEDNGNDGNKKPRLFGDFNKMYKSETIEGTSQLDLRNATFDIVYDEYDNYLNTYSDIMEK